MGGKREREHMQRVVADRIKKDKALCVFGWGKKHFFGKKGKETLSLGEREPFMWEGKK